MSRITMSLENDFEGRVLASFDLNEFASKVRADAIKTIDEELKEVRHCLELAKEQMLIDYVYIACEHLDNIEKLKEKNNG